MAYIDENLMSGEQVVYRARLHWSVFLGPVIVALFALLMFTGQREAASAGGLFLTIAILWGTAAFISRHTSEFAVTNKRVLIKTGVIRRNSLETLLTKVEGIQVQQGILGRMLDYGTIIVKGTGGTSSPFRKIEAPLEFRRKVQEQVATAQK